MFRRKQDMIDLFWTLGAILFVVWMVKDPSGVYGAAQRGLDAWWNIVFPALLPFFIASELLRGFGAVRFLGVLLQPVMRPIFNLPGAASFVMAIGFTSGYPIGAMLTAKLREEGQLTRLEAERLMAFTNNASPLFMLSAIAIGMFSNPELGVLVATAHYFANLSIGLMLRNYRRNDAESLYEPVHTKGLLRRATLELLQHLRNHRQPVGALLSEAIKTSMQNLLTIGGFIIIFAVVINILEQIGIIPLISQLLSLLTKPLGFSPELNQGLAYGFFEITLGVKKISEQSAPLAHQAVAVSLILAWCGISVQAQAASMISKTDLSMKLFLICRLGQALLSSIYVIILSPWLASDISTNTIETLSRYTSKQISWWDQLKFYTITSGMDIIILFLLALLIPLITSGPYIRLHIKTRK